MDSLNYVEYECSNPISSRRPIITRSREEAIGYYFDRGWIVVERHVMVSKTSSYTQARMSASMCWNDNPNKKEFLP